MKKTVQYFSKDYLERCKSLTPEQILEFLDDYAKLVTHQPEKCQLISMKIEPSLLNAFKRKASLEGIPYQTMIKTLMRKWLKHEI